ncbi:hypothetical protein GXM_04408 [Nostoc sphaeroides CCNUC1]|uniref:Uncharacterized protein n=1 Tax=Nostoc sphaeroides CCNUC1 TaxID=2653204 RepID=A0A5P8W2H0_9NOSO|nr:hypothetical protein GXM_04408 [Nostoc sphaeroides CCNUC1]
MVGIDLCLLSKSTINFSLLNSAAMAYPPFPVAIARYQRQDRAVCLSKFSGR